MWLSWCCGCTCHRYGRNRCTGRFRICCPCSPGRTGTAAPPVDSLCRCPEDHFRWIISIRFIHFPTRNDVWQCYEHVQLDFNWISIGLWRWWKAAGYWAIPGGSRSRIVNARSAHQRTLADRNRQTSGLHRCCPCCCSPSLCFSWCPCPRRRGKSRRWGSWEMGSSRTGHRRSRADKRTKSDRMLIGCKWHRCGSDPRTCWSAFHTVHPSILPCSCTSTEASLKLLTFINSLVNKSTNNPWWMIKLPVKSE